MKITDIRKKNTVELEKILTELHTKLQEFRFGMTGGQKKNVREAREIRRSIARINTVLQEAHN
jgi:ribosomal protein L29